MNNNYTGVDEGGLLPQHETEVSTEADAAARVEKQFHDMEADAAVNQYTLEEQQRRQWCVQVTLSAYSLETTRENFLTVADKIYDYVFGARSIR